MFSLSDDGLTGLPAVFLFGGIAVILMVFKNYHYIAPAKNAVNETNQVLQVAMADPVYQKSMQSFPEKFYNYSDAFRLWKLVSENRARDLQEAFNILEMQHYHEDQLSIQEEIKGLQQDIAANSKAAASSARVAAVSSTVSAMNSFRK